MSRMPLLHRGITATRIYPGATRPETLGRDTDRAASPASAALMRDFFVILEFDRNLQYYQRQPVSVMYTDLSGAEGAFTPEFLITYRRDIEPARRMRPLLCDVMTRQDVFENWAALKPRVPAAHRYARKRKWQYRLLTEREIRTAYLENARFLLPYCKLDTDWEASRPLLRALRELRQADPEALLAACATGYEHRAELTALLWHLVSTWQVGIDLTEPLTMRSTIWSKD
jgi:hypothetical protein